MSHCQSLVCHRCHFEQHAGGNWNSPSVCDRVLLRPSVQMQHCQAIFRVLLSLQCCLKIQLRLLIGIFISILSTATAWMLFQLMILFLEIAPWLPLPWLLKYKLYIHMHFSNSGLHIVMLALHFQLYAETVRLRSKAATHQPIKTWVLLFSQFYTKKNLNYLNCVTF